MREGYVLAIIPAREGSKSIIDKNIRLMNSIPLMAYSIQQAIKSELIDRIIVSTDSKKYAEIAKKYGAEVPYLRPKEFSKDTSTDYDVMFDLLNHLIKEEEIQPSLVVHLRPTYPIRLVKQIDKAIKIMQTNKSYDSLRSITELEMSGYKMWSVRDNGLISPINNELFEAYNLPRQVLPKTYIQNASIDIVRTQTIISMKSMTGLNIFGYKMKHNFDIDFEEDFQTAEKILSVIEGGEDILITTKTAQMLLKEVSNKKILKNVILKVIGLGNSINVIQNNESYFKIQEEFHSIFRYELKSTCVVESKVWTIRDILKLQFLEDTDEFKE